MLSWIFGENDIGTPKRLNALAETSALYKIILSDAAYCDFKYQATQYG